MAIDHKAAELATAVIDVADMFDLEVPSELVGMVKKLKKADFEMVYQSLPALVDQMEAAVSDLDKTRMEHYVRTLFGVFHHTDIGKKIPNTVYNSFFREILDQIAALP